MGWTTNLNSWTPDFFHPQYLMISHDICDRSLPCSAINFQAHSRACAKKWFDPLGKSTRRDCRVDMPWTKHAFIVFHGERHGKIYIFWANYSVFFLNWSDAHEVHASNCHADQTFGPLSIGHGCVCAALGKSPWCRWVNCSLLRVLTCEVA